MQLTFFIPSLYDPLASWQRDFAFQASSKCLASLQKNAQVFDIPMGYQAALQYFLGKPNRELSPANYRVQNREDNLLCADPVFLESGMNDVVLAAEDLVLALEEAEELITTLNEFLQQDDLQLSFDKNNPQYWYIQGQKTQAIHSTPLIEAKQRPVFECLLQGENKAYWHRLLGELQMLLYNHPVNQQREAKELKPVNALWFWGEMPQALSQYAEQPAQGLINGDVIAQALAASGDLSIQQAESYAEVDWQQAQHYLIVLDQLQTAKWQDNPNVWQQALTQIEQDWLIPATQQLDQGNVTLTITSDQGYAFQAQAYQAGWRFWSKRHFATQPLQPLA